MGTKGKIPQGRFTPTPEKRPRTWISDPSRDLEKPAWRFRRMVFDGPFGWDRARAEDFIEVQKRFAAFETMTWSEISRDGKSHHYLTNWNSVSAEARKEFDRLCEAKICQPGEQEIIFSFRITGRCRVIGMRLAGIFEPLWWDPEHAFCPSEKKHT